MKVFEELKADDCRWPIAEAALPGERGAFLICGEPIESGRFIAPGLPCPYCATHASIAYEPSRPARRTIAKRDAAEEWRQELILIAAAA
jgi:hypothetical protein